jgi:phosphoribosylamine--glycine ligase
MNESDLSNAKKVMEKTIVALKKERAPFKGVLYGQFMLTKNGPKVIEYNARFGDPEAINVLTLLKSSLVETFQSMADGKLGEVKFDNKCTVVKYLVPDGYPTSPKRDAIVKVNEAGAKRNGVKIYYASVYEKEGSIHTTGSRAFAVVAAENTVEEAEKKAEKGTALLEGPLFHRKDIGTKELIQKRVDHMKDILGRR